MPVRPVVRRRERMEGKPVDAPRRGRSRKRNRRTTASRLDISIGVEAMSLYQGRDDLLEAVIVFRLSELNEGLAGSAG